MRFGKQVLQLCKVRTVEKEREKHKETLSWLTLLTCYGGLEWEMTVNWSPIACIRLYSMCHCSICKHQVGRTLSRHKRSKRLTLPLTPRGQLCVYAYIWEMYLNASTVFVVLTTVNDIIENPGGNVVLEYFVCRHMVQQKGQRAV